MNYLVLIYFMINSYILGLSWSNWKSLDREDVIWRLLVTIPFLLAGCFIYLAFYIFQIFLWLYSYFQIQFFYDFYFTKKWHNLKESNLQFINLNSKTSKYRYCVNLVNIRYDYKVD